MIKEIINSIFPLPRIYLLVINVLLAFLGFLIIYGIRDYFQASREFRNTIFAALEGIYPTIEYISIEQKDITIHNSIRPIKISGDKFKNSLPFFCVGGFDRALTYYYDIARNTDWTKDRQIKASSEMNGIKEVAPSDLLYIAVNNLLKYAKYK